MITKATILTLAALVILSGTASGADETKSEAVPTATATLAGAKLQSGEFQLLSYGIGYGAGFHEGSMTVFKIFATLRKDAPDSELFKECSDKLEPAVKQTIADFEKTKQEQFNQKFADSFREGVVQGTKFGITYARQLFDKVTKLAQSGETSAPPDMNVETTKKTREAMLEQGKVYGLSAEQARSVTSKLPEKL